MNIPKNPRVVISGGGTGGHIFPALAIAEALRRQADAEILFIGAQGRMEMEKVPAAGFKIIGLPVAGIDRKRLWRNISVLKKFLKSRALAKQTLREFKPDVVIGVGGYASGPTLKAAQELGIPTLLQEQNSYAGVANKLLSKKAKKICVAYEGMERFFPAEKIELTGNPIRKSLLSERRESAVARAGFGLRADRPTVLVIGGSLGALTLNRAMTDGIKILVDSGIQVIWQTGKNYADKAREAAKGLKGVVTTPFITDMAAAYSAADLVVSRAGAGSISELQLLAKPSILVPSPNVAEDHQTKNARALANRGAAVLIPDSEAYEHLCPTILSLLSNPSELASMAINVGDMALKDSDVKIANLALSIIDPSASSETH